MTLHVRMPWSRGSAKATAGDAQAAPRHPSGPSRHSASAGEMAHSPLPVRPKPALSPDVRAQYFQPRHAAPVATPARPKPAMAHQPRRHSVLPDAGDLDHPHFGLLGAGLKRYVTGRAHQYIAHGEHFGAEAAQRYEGSCVGMSAVWLRLHQARPDASAVDRLNTTMSFEGSTHAEIYQKSYDAEALAMDDETWNRHPEHPGFRHQVAQRPMDQAFFGMEKDWARNGKLDLQGMAEAMTQVEGYASLGWRALDNSGNPSSHQLAMFRDLVQDTITVFDPTSGEFQLPSQEAHQFLLAVQENYRGRNPAGFNFDSFHLNPVTIKGPVDETPLAGLAERLEPAGGALWLPDEVALGPTAR